MNWSERRVLVTGITGFAGQRLSKHLLRSGCQLTGLVRKSEPQTQSGGTHPSESATIGLSLVQGNVLQIETIEQALSACEPEVVFHLAAQGVPSQSYDYPVESFETNAVGTVNLLEALRRTDIESKVIYASSSLVYGIVVLSEAHYRRLVARYGEITPEPRRLPELPLDESSPLRPNSPYAVGKLAGDLACLQYSRSYNLDVTVARAFNHEGVGRSRDFVTAKMAMLASEAKSKGTRRWNVGDTTAMRDWTHVEDVVSAYLLLADKGQASHVYNVGSMRTNSILTFALWCLESSGLHVYSVGFPEIPCSIEDPLDEDLSTSFDASSEKTKLDSFLFNHRLEKGPPRQILVHTSEGIISLESEGSQPRADDSPIIICDNSKIRKLGFRVTRPVRSIAEEMVRIPKG